MAYSFFTSTVLDLFIFTTLRWRPDPVGRMNEFSPRTHDKANDDAVMLSSSFVPGLCVSPIIERLSETSFNTTSSSPRHEKSANPGPQPVDEPSSGKEESASSTNADVMANDVYNESNHDQLGESEDVNEHYRQIDVCNIAANDSEPSLSSTPDLSDIEVGNDDLTYQGADQTLCEGSVRGEATSQSHECANNEDEGAKGSSVHYEGESSARLGSAENQTQPNCTTTTVRGIPKGGEQSLKHSVSSPDEMSPTAATTVSGVDGTVFSDIAREPTSTNTNSTLLTEGSPPRNKPNKDGSLLRLFQSELFDTYFHMYYLHHRQEPGIHDYLVNLLYRRTEEDIYFYLPQLW